MKKIYKYYLDEAYPGQEIPISIPEDSKVLCAKNQSDRPVLYIEIGESNTDKDFIFLWFETGYGIPSEGLTYVDTVLIVKDCYVMHVYQKEE